MSTDADRIGFATADLMANITHEIRDFSPRPVSFGGYSDIHTGVWHSPYGEMKVAIKVIRATLTAPDTDELPRVLRHEIRVWKKLVHRNIHIMCGFFEGYGSAPALVSPWYENGDINRYVRSRATAPDIDLLKLKLFADITSGLKYLHEQYIVHGDIKGGNVLISDDGVARLCDFGLSHLLLEHSQSITLTGVKGTLRWMAPELVLSEGSRPSSASDMWACGCLFIEVWGTVKPYHTKTNDHQVIFALAQGELPARPADMPDTVWTIVEACCRFDVRRRTSPVHVVEFISLHLTIQRLRHILTRRGPLDSAGSDLLKAIDDSLRSAKSQQIAELFLLGDTGLVAEVVRLFASWSLSIVQRFRLFPVEVFKWCFATFGTGRLIPSAGDEHNKLSDMLLDCACTQTSRISTDFSPLASDDAEDEDEDDSEDDEDNETDQSKLRPFARLLAAVDPEYEDAVMLRFAREPLKPWSIAWFPDSDRIAVGFTNGTVDILSTSSGATLHHLHHLKGYGYFAHNVAVSPDGRLVASCPGGSTVQLWDAETGNAVSMLRHYNNLDSVAFSPDGTHIASVSHCGTIRIWSCETGASVLNIDPLSGLAESVSSIAYLPDGSRIISGSWDHTIRVWDARTGACILGPLFGHEGRITCVASSPDGSRFVSGSLDTTVRIWDASSGKTVGAPMKVYYVVVCVAYSPDGTRIISGSADSTSRIWDAATGVLIHQLRKHTGSSNSISVSPDGEKIAFASRYDYWYNTVQIRDATDESMRWQF